MTMMPDVTRLQRKDNHHIWCTYLRHCSEGQALH